MTDTKRHVEIHARMTAYRGRYRIERVKFSFDRVSRPGRIENAEREVFDRGDSVAALIHDIDRDVIVLTEQFRVATFEKGPGYLVEAAAGSVDEGETPEQCMRRELMEETGYRAGELRPIATYYSSPGASSERIFLYYAPVRQADLVAPSASGLEEENEDIRRVEMPREAFLRSLEAGEFREAKILVAGWWLANQPGRGAPPG